jgi:hypothetical protein
LISGRNPATAFPAFSEGSPANATHNRKSVYTNETS